MRVQPLIAVRDVVASSRWYQDLLACESGHGGPEYERLVKDGEIVLQLHAWGAHDHPNLGDPTPRPMVAASCRGSRPTPSTPRSRGHARSAPTPSRSRS